MTDVARLIERLRVDMENGYHSEIMAEIVDILERQMKQVAKLERELNQEKKKVAAFQELSTNGLCIECVLPHKVCTCPYYVK